MIAGREGTAMIPEHPTALGARHATHPRRTVKAFKQALVDHLYYVRGQAAYTASPNDLYMALAYTVRDYLMDRWRRTVDAYYENRPKFVYYLSAEYLPGRQLTQNLLYTGTWDLARRALADFGFDLDALVALDVEPGLGNGGLGRLAACFMDSLATLDIPSVSYGIRYEFGIFRQAFHQGWQVESPDDWLFYGNPWEFPQPDHLITVGFGGTTEHFTDAHGRYRVYWNPAQTVLGEPSHTLVPGYGTGTVNMLRLWRARATQEFDFRLFDVGDYARAVEQKTYSENLTKVLYPNDHTPQGRELRLRQQYFFVTCSLEDILRRFLAFSAGWEEFTEKLVIQLNDTHPALAVAEMMRLLVDVHDLDWDQAWRLTQGVFAYTLHTLMPEALEKWPVELFGRLLPRHLEIVYEINQRFLDEVRARFPGDEERVRRMSLIEETPERMVRMAHLAAVGSFSLNGVAELQSTLMREHLLADFYALWPERFNNKTNGVTPRRFMRLANPRLSRLINARLGEGWLTDLEQLARLEPHAERPDFRAAWRAVKQQNKDELATLVAQLTGTRVDSHALYDVMAKRLHEYKRQLLKVLHIITLYQRLQQGHGQDIVPRVFLFGAKAAPGYQMAKLIIRLVHGVAAVVNGDPAVAGRLAVAFLPNFNVTLGERLYPAADLSEQISLAGYEASGTGNMKFALNGALTIGTLDGANVEIRERVGAENFFLFGLTAQEAAAWKARGYRPREEYERNAELRAALDAVAAGVFSGADAELFRPIVDDLLGRDEYMVLADYAAYVACQDTVDQAFRDVEAWTRKSILNTARCGYFSSDRAMRQYCDEIWKAAPLPVALK
jgi:starch phosphorylase